MALLFKRLLLVFLLALVLVPVLQARFHFNDEVGLAGAFELSQHPELTWESLRNNSYQPALEAYVEDHLGYRPNLIRLRNQLSFSLFRVARSSDIVVGEQEVLFQPGPIASYAGRDLIDSTEIRFRVQLLHKVQQELARRGVQLLFVMAPNKARFQPETLPSHLRPAVGTPSNYSLFMRAMRADSINLLDLVPVFAKWKKTTPYPLFPRGGTHWSGYGATLAADTLLRRLEPLGHMRFPTVRTLGPPHIVYYTDSAKGTDSDISWPLNLMWQRETTPLAYRRLAFDAPGPGQTRPAALFVGDSFNWGLMMFSPYMQREFSDDTRFWYYNRMVYQPDSTYHDTGIQVASLDLRQQLESRKFVVLLLTEHNLVEHEFNFTDQVYQLYHPFSDQDRVAIDQLVQRLSAEATWEEQAQDAEGFQQRTRRRAQDLYLRQLLK